MTGSADSQRSSLRALVVDDDADQRMLVQRLLARVGITLVETVPDGDRAIEVARRQQPHLVLLDLAMPGRSGFEVLPELQAVAPDASIVVLSNLPRRRLEAKLVERGAVGFVEKRVAPDRLVREVLIAAEMTHLVRSEVTLELDADRTSSRVARRFVREMLAPEDDALVGDVELLVSELVSNAVVHASSAPRLEVRLSSNAVHVAVYDDDPTLPRRREPDPALPGGRGLMLVEQVADRWGAEPQETGKVVWFEIARAGR